MHSRSFSFLAVLCYGISISVLSSSASTTSGTRRRVNQAAAPRSILFPKLRCALALQRNGFNLEDFDNYPKYFRNNSVVMLAQAGRYQGPSDIEEYIKFAFYGFTPYLVDDGTKHTTTRANTKNKVMGYHNGQCEFVTMYKSFAIFNSSTTKVDMPQFNFVTMVKLYLDLKQNYISEVHVFFPPDFLRVFFDVALNSDNTRRYLCENVMSGPCGTVLSSQAMFSQSTGGVDCMAALASLPMTQGPLHHFDGNSTGCRAMHGVFARTNPMHCAHLSVSPLADPLGRFKCQNSLQIAPTDLFSDDDMAAFHTFSKQKKIDPELGHDSSM